MLRAKLIVTGVKFGVALLIRCVEWTSNRIFGFAENLTMGHQLPINVTDAYKLSDGPKLENITQLKTPVLHWLIKQLHKLNK